jgi:RimJ/RimL family protein N-acetyltransferase
MGIQNDLFEGELICFTPIDQEKDAPIEARWSEDAGYLQSISLKPAKPLSIAKVKKNMDKLEKEQDESHSVFNFAVRTRLDDRLVGFARVAWVEWNQGAGGISLGIGDPQDRRKGYGWEILNLLLRFAYHELNLYRVSAVIPEYNIPALRLFEKACFVREVARRKAVNRAGRYWDLYYLGLLSSEWAKARPEQTSMLSQEQLPD